MSIVNENNFQQSEKILGNAQAGRLREYDDSDLSRSPY